MVFQKTVMATNDEEIKLQFLLCGSCEVLPVSYIKLRSYLNTYISNLADRHDLKVLKNFRNRNKTCLYCYSPWSSDTTSFQLLPSKKSKFYQAQSNIGEKGKKKEKLNELRNTLVLKCKVCSKNSSFSLIKKKSVKADPKNEIVESVKKRKKKDKSSGLAVTIKKSDDHFPEIIVKKKKKRIGNSEETTLSYPSYKNSQINQLKIVKNKLNSLNDSSKTLMLNPYATQMQRKFSRKKGKKLQRLKKAVKEEKNLTRKTLKDFLTLI